ncbi:unnamed protein product [Calypogeia fissa]
MGGTKRPRSEIASVIIHIKGEKDDEWIPKKIERNSWVTLSAPKRGPWAKQGDFIAQIKKFKFSANATLESVLVAHAYYHRQLEVESKPRHGVPTNHLNYIYPTQCEDWQDPYSIKDLVVVVHGAIGEVTRGSRSHKDLLESGIFFYDASYVPPSSKGKLGKLIPTSSPPLDDPSWPIPDMSSSESFRARLYSDIQFAMKGSTGGRLCRLNWFMPLHIMVDLFNVQIGDGMHHTKTMFVFKPASEALLASLMDSGWDVK